MWKTAWLVVTVVSLIVHQSERLMAQTQAPDVPASSDVAGPIPRVRSADSAIATLIARAYQWSVTFRHVVNLIDATDGIVYVEAGRCGGVRACLALTVTVAGPNRILRIVVDTRRADCEVIASIGHELWHAIEVLREPSITSDGAMYLFLARGREQNPPRWLETKGALRAGDDVLTELRDHAKEVGDTCAPN